MKKPYRLRKRKGARYWEYKLPADTCFHSTGKRKKSDAEQFAIEKVYGPQNPGVSTDEPLSQYVESLFVRGECRYIKRKESKGKSVSKQTAQMRRGHIKNHILPAFGSRIPRSITQTELDDWLTDLELGNKTKNHILDTLRIIWTELEQSEVVRRNVPKGIERFAVVDAERDVLRADEIETLFPEDVAAGITIWGSLRWATYFAVLASTGMRLSEARALEWSDIHRTEDGSVYVSVTKAVKGDGSVGAPKNGKPRIARLFSGGLRYLMAWHRNQTDHGRSGLIFPSHGDKPLSRSYCLKKLKRVLPTTKIELGERNITVHSFRHTFITIYRPVLGDDTLNSMTGHSSVAMTERYYHPAITDMVRHLHSRLQVPSAVWDGSLQQLAVPQKVTVDERAS